VIIIPIYGLVRMRSTLAVSLTNFTMVIFDELAFFVAHIITRHVM
jgi:hypothetical protein